MSAKQSLGRGFEALIPTKLDESLLTENQERIQKILINDIVPNKDQPRRQWDDNALAELTMSVKRHGVLQPIIVVKDEDRFRIVAGERRWRAAKSAGLNNIPAIVRSLKELEEVELALIENIQRVDLSPLEQALAVLKLQQQFSLSLDEVAKKLGKAPSTISNLSRLLQLPDAAMDALREGRINEGHARAILALRGIPSKQEELLSSILNNNWTVRQAEQFAIQVKQAAKAGSVNTEITNDKATISKISGSLNTGVKISRKSSGGQIIIQFKDEDQLQQITEKLSQ